MPARESSRFLLPTPMTLPDLLHAPRWRPYWRGLLVVLILVVCWLAFTPKPPVLLDGDNSDKIEHALAFISLSIAAFLAGRGGYRGAWIAALAMIAFGGFIELAQTQVPGRSSDWADLAADAVGIAIGLLLVSAARSRIPPPA